ncbi:hypothetical protein FOA52_013294 [Chlamydomonas sp. UWO 241]|nr:hypothetical protein FOA52_013294 [Chlamydomonas sp. UWO 241]
MNPGRDAEEPLLHVQHADGSDAGDAAECKLVEERHDAAAEGRRVLGLALPISTSEALSFGAYLITTAQVGRIGSAQLSAITLARSTFHITGLSLVVGLASGVSTLSGQAFGSCHFGLAGTITQRAILINLIACCAIIAGWTQLEPLLLLGQDPELSHLASEYIMSISPALVMEAVYFCLKHHLQAQGVVGPLTAIAAVQTLVTPIANHVFINVLDMGMPGVAVAYVVVTAVTLMGVITAVVWCDVAWRKREERTWPAWSQRSLTGWGQYLGVALPSTAMICADWWCFEAIILAIILVRVHVCVCV